MRLYTFLQELAKKEDLNGLIKTLAEQGHHLSVNDLRHFYTNVCQCEMNDDFSRAVETSKLPPLAEALLYIAELREELEKPPVEIKDDHSSSWIDWFSFFA